MTAARVLALTRYGRLGASSRLRSLQFLPWFERAGLTTTVQPLLPDAALSRRYVHSHYGITSLLGSYARRLLALAWQRDFDLIWIEKEALPWLPAWLERALLRGTPYVLDYDDAQFHVYDLHRSNLVRRLYGRRLDALMSGARLVVAGNEYLAERARRAGSDWVEVVPTVIDLNRYCIRPRLSADVSTPPRIVWIGSPSTVRYLDGIRTALTLLAEHHRFILRVIGSKFSAPGVEVEYFPWSEDTEAASIGECDIGIMPLMDTPWERGKCGYKLIQYMACGLPVVASPVGVNREIVKDGVNGFLAHSETDWAAILSQLLEGTELRHSMGRAGRTIVEQFYCVQRVGPRMATMLSQAATFAR